MAFKSTSNSWLKIESNRLRATENMMASVIVTRAKILAPRKSGDLIASGRVERKKSKTSAVFGGNGVPYGRIQELGGTIRPKNGRYLSWIGKDGQRIFAKSVTIKGKHYLEKAGDSVAKEPITKYYKMAGGQ